MRSIYLRRGGGRGEQVPGASDLDFFLVLHTVPAQTEMEFLKDFWERYNFWRAWFPFLGEVLMGDSNEVINWVQSPTVRSFEAPFSWKLLHGEDLLPKARQTLPDLRDEYSEALKCYWALLQPILKLSEEKLQLSLPAHDPAAVHLRHAAKATLDLFRIHFGRNFALLEKEALGKKTRKELALTLPKEVYGARLELLVPVLGLEEPFLSQEKPFELFSDLIYRACLCLHEIAEDLEKQTESTTKAWTIQYHGKSELKDPYSFAVRELFAERVLFRHQAVVERSILSESTAHLYFVLKHKPEPVILRDLILDLRDVSFSFDKFSVPMPLTEVSFRQLEKTSLLDTPFHSFYAHHEIRLDAEGGLTSKKWPAPEPKIPWSMLVKTFTELNFALRFPPDNIGYLMEHMLTMVLSLRLGLEHGVLTTDFDELLNLFQQRFPTRAEQLRTKVGPYMLEKNALVDQFWERLDQDLQGLEQKSPQAARNLRARFASMRREWVELKSSGTPSTDLWINLTPFFRMEMNSLKDRFFTERPALRI